MIEFVGSSHSTRFLSGTSSCCDHEALCMSVGPKSGLGLLYNMTCQVGSIMLSVISRQKAASHGDERKFDFIYNHFINTWRSEMSGGWIVSIIKSFKWFCVIVYFLYFVLIWLRIFKCIKFLQRYAGVAQHERTGKILSVNLCFQSVKTVMFSFCALLYFK